MKFDFWRKQKKRENEINVKLKKLSEDAVVPTYAHHGDVGMDMTAISVEYDETRDVYIYHTGLAFESDFNIGQFLFPRSSNSKTECYLTNSVGVADSSIYRGEIQFRFKNRTSINTIIETESLKAFRDEFLHQIQKWDGSKKTWDEAFVMARDHANTASELAKHKILEDARSLKYAPYSVGDRVGQMVFMNYPTVNIEVVDELSETERGNGGFGSTGK